MIARGARDLTAGHRARSMLSHISKLDALTHLQIRCSYTSHLLEPPSIFYIKRAV
jgi:hypothetical protein